MSLRISDGPMSVTLDEGVERFVRSLMDAATTESVRVLEEVAAEVKATAEADWYGSNGVTRRTGKSGALAITTDIRGDDSIIVKVGSTDLAKAKYVHRPGVFAMTAVEATQAQYSEAKRKGGAMADSYFHARKSDKTKGIEAGRYYRNVPSQKASDGKYILQEFVVKPGKAKIAAAAKRIAAEVAAKAGGGHGG